MINLLLPLIYLAFISLGLPDALLGSAWPAIYPDFSVPVSYAGIISMIISLGTIFSSLFSDRIIAWLGTGKVSAFSVALTAGAILGFSYSPNFWVLCICAIPYGLGAGSIDVALNNYVALHFKSTHMNWLHCCWGIGATLGPYIMGISLAAGGSWKTGYWYIAWLQLLITAILFLSLPLWKRCESLTETVSPNKSGENSSQADRSGNPSAANLGDTSGASNSQARPRPLKLSQVIKIRGVKEMMTCFFCYSILEQTTGLWAATYLKLFKGMDAASAAAFAGMLFLGVTLGRAVSGFLAIRFNDQQMIRLGIVLAAVGLVILLIPGSAGLAVWAMILIGLGCSPIYPAMIHVTPLIFGKEHSRAVIGVQMASSYVAVLDMPPLFGLIASNLSVGLLPLYLAGALVVFVLMQRRLSRLQLEPGS